MPPHSAVPFQKHFFMLKSNLQFLVYLLGAKISVLDIKNNIAVAEPFRHVT